MWTGYHLHPAVLSQFILMSFVLLSPFTATHQSDSPILNENMHVVWARGQDKGAEAGTFYGQDEFKYHGRGMQRGVAKINFFGKHNLLHPSHNKTFITYNQRPCIISYLYVQMMNIGVKH